MQGSVTDEEGAGQVVNHDELRMTTKVEVRQDSFEATTRDRISACERPTMPMPATRVVG
jgi:hypothetical protein